MFRSSIRSENSRRERRDDGDDADGDRHGRGEEGLEPRVERAGAGNEDDGRCERDHEHVEGELGNVPPQVAKRLPDVVAPLTDGGVGTEQVLRRPSGRELDDEQCDGERRDDAVQPAESRDRRAQAARFEDREHERREEDGRAEGDRLHAGREREPDQREQEDDPERHRTFEHDEEHEHDNEEERVEGVLRHDGARVRERGHGDREQRSEEREAVAHDPPREGERRYRGERHQHRVRRLHGGIRLGQALEQRVGRADQERVHDAVAGIGLVAEQRLAGVGDAARDLRPDDLVDHDERRDDVAGQSGTDERRSRRRSPPARPRSESCGARSTQARPRRGGGRSPSPRPSPPRSRRPPQPR